LLWNGQSNGIFYLVNMCEAHQSSSDRLEDEHSSIGKSLSSIAKGSNWLEYRDMLVDCVQVNSTDFLSRIRRNSNRPKCNRIHRWIVAHNCKVEQSFLPWMPCSVHIALSYQCERISFMNNLESFICLNRSSGIEGTNQPFCR
jgi:hypothetical protein